MAGTIDRDRMAAHRESTPKPGGDRLGLYKFQEGTTWIILCGPGPNMDGLPYLEVDQHYDVGPKKKSCVCLGKQNAVLWREDTQALLAERGIEVSEDDGCEQCVVADGRTLTPEQKKRQKAKTQYVMNVIPWAFQPPPPKAGKRKPREELDDSERVPRQAMVGWSVWNGVCDCIEDDGDPTDPMAAVLLRVERDDSGAITEYKVSTDIETAKNPLRLPKALRALVREHYAPGAEGDPIRLVANFTKSHEDIQALLRGEEPGAGKPKGGKAASDKPSCFGYDCDPSDSECKACPYKVDCAGKCDVEVPGAKPAGRAATTTRPKPDDEDEDDVPLPAPPSKPAKPAAPKAPPPDDDDEDDEPPPAKPAKPAKPVAPPPEDDEDDPPPAKPAKPAKPAAPPVEDDEEAPPAPKPTGKKPKAAAAAPAAAAADAGASDDEALDEFEKELAARKAARRK